MPPLEVEASPPTGQVLSELEVILQTLSALAEMWEEESEARTRGAEASALFGPRMMILVSEASVMAACAGQLREAIKIARDRYPHLMTDAIAMSVPELIQGSLDG